MKRAFRFFAAFSLVAALGIIGTARGQQDTLATGHKDMNMKMRMSVGGHDSVATPGAHRGKAGTRHAAKLVPQKTCPVMGNPIDTSIYVDYRGKRVYFCCAMCPETFKKDPQKYLKILAARGEEPIDIPKK